jgi:hypothetical protein
MRLDEMFSCSHRREQLLCLKYSCPIPSEVIVSKKRILCKIKINAEK